MFISSYFCNSLYTAVEKILENKNECKSLSGNYNGDRQCKQRRRGKGLFRPFLNQIKGALTKDLLIRGEDVQVLHGFASAEDAQAYLGSDLFKNDVFVRLKGLWKQDPEVRIYTVA